jgi:hypothetical protein
LTTDKTPAYNPEQELARERARGAQLGTNLNRRWCFICEHKKPTMGGTYHGALFRCADCQPERKA